MLTKSLPRIAARVLHNTKCVPQNLKFKFELVAEAYGSAAVEQDFERWCEENRDRNPKYPITEYLKVVDSRLGTVADEQKAADLQDPRVAEVLAFTYEMTGILPPAKSVRELLAVYEPAEIKAALKEYSDNLSDKELKSGMRSFFSEGGAVAVIYARRNRG